MADEIKVTNEDIKERFGNFQNVYTSAHHVTNFSALIMGLYGVGKTRFLATGRKPILIDSFDPRGTVILETTHADDIKAGNIVIRTFWDEQARKPSQHEKWEEIFEQDKEMRFFDYFGTYAIDSFTTWLEAVANRVSVEQGRNRKVQKLAQQDYPIIYDYAKDVVKTMSGFTCDFIVTAHLDRYQEDATGSLVTDIRTYKGLRTELPLLFTEKYVLETQDVPKSSQHPNGIRYRLHTSAAGTFRASTQLGANGKLNAIEEPNIKNILRKVGLPTDDKPSINDLK